MNEDTPEKGTHLITQEQVVQYVNIFWRSLLAAFGGAILGGLLWIFSIDKQVAANTSEIISLQEDVSDAKENTMNVRLLIQNVNHLTEKINELKDTVDTLPMRIEKERNNIKE